MSAARAQPGVRFLYLPAVDLAAMRTFYGGLLGLREIHHDADEGWLAFDCDGLQFTIFHAPDAVAAPTAWATQPGWQGTTGPLISWSVVLDEDGYRAAVEALRTVDTATLHDEPVWVGYWSFPVRDPMGNTVELSWPADEPPTDRWPPPSPKAG